MTYSLNHIVNSIAAMLKEHWPEYTVYDARTQQGTKYPCFYIQLMPSQINDEIDGREMRNIGLDVIFLQQRNLPDASQKLLDVADGLDELLDYISYTDGDHAPVLLHTHDRNYSIEDQELHYKITLRNRVARDEIRIKINEVEEMNVEVEE